MKILYILGGLLFLGGILYFRHKLTWKIKKEALLINEETIARPLEFDFVKTRLENIYTQIRSRVLTLDAVDRGSANIKHASAYKNATEMTIELHLIKSQYSQKRIQEHPEFYKLTLTVFYKTLTFDTALVDLSNFTDLNVPITMNVLYELETNKYVTLNGNLYGIMFKSPQWHRLYELHNFGTDEFPLMPIWQELQNQHKHFFHDDTLTVLKLHNKNHITIENLRLIVHKSDVTPHVFKINFDPDEPDKAIYTLDGDIIELSEKQIRTFIDHNCFEINDDIYVIADEVLPQLRS